MLDSAILLGRCLQFDIGNHHEIFAVGWRSAYSAAIELAIATGFSR
jgi:hypothetical protein